MSLLDLRPPGADRVLGDPVLDNAAWNSLNGEHQRFALRHGGAARYHPEVARFVAVEDAAEPRCWADLSVLIGPGGTVHLSASNIRPPVGWTVEKIGEGVQFVDVSLTAEIDREAVRLGAADVPEILDLVERTRPGPFAVRTIEMGNYIGIRRRGALVAMAGERLHPPGWTEISAVCTDPAFRGQGLGTRLIRAVAAGIRDRGEQVFLHALSTNTNAIRLYESIGFQRRRGTAFFSVTAPAR